MTVFVIIPTPRLEAPALRSLIVQHFPDRNYPIDGGAAWLVSANMTSKAVADLLKISDGPSESALVLEVASYFGRANPNIWKWNPTSLEVWMMSGLPEKPDEARVPDALEMAQVKPIGVLAPLDQVDTNQVMLEFQESLDDVKSLVSTLTQNVGEGVSRLVIIEQAIGGIQASLAVGSPALARSTEDAEDIRIAGLPLVERLRYIAKNDPMSFIVMVLALAASVYALVYSVPPIAAYILHLVTPLAHSQPDKTPGAPSADMIKPDSFVLLIVGVISFWSLFTISCSQKSNNVTYAKDILRVIVGFIGGFFGAGRGH